MSDTKIIIGTVGAVPAEAVGAETIVVAAAAPAKAVVVEAPAPAVEEHEPVAEQVEKEAAPKPVKAAAKRK